MNKEYFLKQCVLRRPNKNGVTYTTSYLPEKYAYVGNVLKLKDNDKWVDGWIVEKVSEEKISSRLVPDLTTAHKRHRKNTDI